LGKNPAFQNTLKRPMTRAKIMDIVIRIPGLIDPFGGAAISVEHGSKNNTMKISGMSFQRLDAKFFRRAKKLNRAVEITDSHAYIPAVKEDPEIRVPLPNRRPKTMEERQVVLDERTEGIGALDEEIEVERRVLIDLTRKYTALKSGAADVVVQNLKIQALMEKRKSLQYPERFIEELKGITLKDIFQSKRDMRKVEGGKLYQITHRVEPITSLYVDLTGGATAAATAAEGSDDDTAPASLFSAVTATGTTAKATAKPKTAEETKVGAIIGQTKKILKLKKTGQTAPASVGGSGLT
jgi:hypothetical protein